ncbi:methyltransferase family protein [Hydrocarboniphaga effusa]|uniref:Isoprenylcysteine carboxyl methyltransferase n=1 Tax=Hydrocarboniphaga effusa AP103 TaxID=1172194 RepID=I7Z877_9GAMM|nr:isoprenylcysteine carboxylmethyltransferase family protein [Hydrocarboniphaga effusa]EIT67857.1 hypothetical protein WQQ_42920 [Hydrocarboniphaga effusa AP103]
MKQSATVPAASTSLGADPPAAMGPIQRRRRQRLQWLGILLLPMLLVCRSAWPEGGPAHEGIEALGQLLMLVCIAGRTGCTLYVGGRKCAELVTDGPYSVSRNPLYGFSLLGAIGAGLQSGSLTLGAVIGLGFFAMFDRLIRQEERYLAAQFTTFANYRAATPRWLPKPGLWRSADQLLIQPRHVFRTLRDASLFLLAFPVFELIGWAQASGYVGALVALY